MKFQNPMQQTFFFKQDLPYYGDQQNDDHNLFLFSCFLILIIICAQCYMYILISFQIFNI